MSSNIATAQREYYARPADERYPNLDALISAAEDEKAGSVERTYNVRDMRIQPATDAATGVETIELASTRGAARLTHWAFGQLCRMLGAPAAYVRTLPPAVIADALNFGISRTENQTDATLLVKAPNGNPSPMVRSITSTAYGRVWDAQLYAAVRDQVVRHGSSAGGDWTLPPTWDGQPAGAYRGDRDSFVILTNGGSIVTDPSAGNDGRLYRGLMLRNSEVGAASVVIERILYRYICGNHMLWGAVIDQSFRRRHVGEMTLRDTMREIAKIAYEWSNASAARDEAIIRGLINTEIATTKDAVISELRGMGASKETAENMYAKAEQTETASPRSFWGAANGLTRMSQDTQYQDDRFILDQLAATIMARGRAKIAV